MASLLDGISDVEVRLLWRPLPDLETSAEAWIQAGGAHHTAFSYDVTPEQLALFAGMAEVEYLQIG